MIALAVILGVLCCALALLLCLVAGRAEDWRQACTEARRENEELKLALWELDPGRIRKAK